MHSYEDFLAIMDRLLSDSGCPWDRAQTHASLRPYMLEEAYEVADAIDQGDMSSLREELGDVLLEVVFHAKLAEREGQFTMADVVEGIAQKMISRHSHIFGDDHAETPRDVEDNWEAIKYAEKKYAGHTEDMRGVPKALPANIRAEKVLKRGRKSGITVPLPEEWVAALNQGMAHLLKLAENGESSDNLSAWFGAMALMMVQISSFFEINMEFALTNAIETYITTFDRLERANVPENQAETRFSRISLLDLILGGARNPYNKED